MTGNAEILQYTSEPGVTSANYYQSASHHKCSFSSCYDTITMSGWKAFIYLIAIVVHGDQAQQMVHVTTLAKLAHQLWLDAFVLQDAFIA